jgi:hypothetical protein
MPWPLLGRHDRLHCGFRRTTMSPPEPKVCTTGLSKPAACRRWRTALGGHRLLEAHLGDRCRR